MSTPLSARSHTIKLKGPWTVVRGPDEGATEAVIARRTVHLPVEWRSLFGTTAGTAAFERRFNRPTGLTPGHRVRVLFRDVAGLHRVQLNGNPLPLEPWPDGVQAVNITGRMEPHNRLTVEVAFDPGQNAGAPGGLWQPVLLQIEDRADDSTGMVL